MICEGEEALVFSNDITYYENNVQKNISIDLSKENFGVSSEDMQILKILHSDGRIVITTI